MSPYLLSLNFLLLFLYIFFFSASLSKKKKNKKKIENKTNALCALVGIIILAVYTISYTKVVRTLGTKHQDKI